MCGNREAKFDEHERRIAITEQEVQRMKLRLAWVEKENYYTQVEVAKKQIAIRGVPAEMTDQDIVLSIENACRVANVDPQFVDLVIPKVTKLDDSTGRGPVQFLTFLTGTLRKQFMDGNWSKEDGGTRIAPWFMDKAYREVEYDGPGGTTTQQVGYNVPKPDPSIRARIKCTPGLTQFERRLSSPLHGMMKAYRKTIKRFEHEGIVTKWKTMILTD